MKRIVMLEAMCWNEKSWARVMSRFGHVSLIQQGFGYSEHTEWESGQCVFNPPKKRAVKRFTPFDEATFGLMLALGVLKDARPILKSGRADVIIASANSMTLAALFLRATGKTRKVVCLVGDFFPLHGKFSVRLYRKISGALTTWLARHSDEVWSISPRIPMTYANPRNFIIPIWIDNVELAAGPRDEIGYIGVPSPDHAIEVLFEICRKHNLRLNVIGDSPYLQSVKSSAPPGTTFHGVVSDQAKISKILSRCFCGYAIYRKTGPQNYSYFGFPSKTLAYLSSGTPIVTTDTAHFMQDIRKFGIGCVVEPQPEQIEQAILAIKEKFTDYHEAIHRFREIWNADVEKFHRERLAVLLNQH